LFLHYPRTSTGHTHSHTHAYTHTDAQTHTHSHTSTHTRTLVDAAGMSAYDGTGLAVSGRTRGMSTFGLGVSHRPPPLAAPSTVCPPLCCRCGAAAALLPKPLCGSCCICWRCWGWWCGGAAALLLKPLSCGCCKCWPCWRWGWGGAAALLLKPLC